jgi:hypothetical protein
MARVHLRDSGERFVDSAWTAAEKFDRISWKINFPMKSNLLAWDVLNEIVIRL